MFYSPGQELDIVLQPRAGCLRLLKIRDSICRLTMDFTLNYSVTSKLLISAGLIASAAAIWHLLIIFGGPGWFTFTRAPQPIIDSAKQGTLLAPIATVIIASLMFACSAFAFSAAGLISKIPLLKPALITISGLCSVRALSSIPILITPSGLDVWELIASTVWFYVGICFIAGSLVQLGLDKPAT